MRPRRAKLLALAPRVPGLAGRVSPPPKRTLPYYLTAEHRAWREAVLDRAGRRCQWDEGGSRCMQTEATSRLYADHVVELHDGGDALDVANGQCLCHVHHTIKTNRVRAARQRAHPRPA